MRVFLLVLFFVSLTELTEGVISSHQVDGQELPGWQKPLPSRQYSGYIEIDQEPNAEVADSETSASSSKRIKKYFHYWFVESESNPKSDPLVLWLNGGPGCSSLEGYLSENGPLHFNKSAYTGGIPQLIRNEFTWSKITNMLYLESPVGVGLSYYEGPSSPVLNDETTAEDNYQFLMKWFKSYSEYRNNEFYITGESYAGIYIPTLVQKITEGNKIEARAKINLKGFAIGNGCTGNEVGSCSYNEKLKLQSEFLYGHGLYPTSLYKEIKKTCEFSSPSSKCLDLLSEMLIDVGPVNMYNVYGPCLDTESMTNSKIGISLYSYFEKYQYAEYESMKSNRLKPIYCIDDLLHKALLNDKKTRQVLHVASVDKTGLWILCDDKVGEKYKPTVKNLLLVYPKLIEKYRTLIYNGNIDSVVSYIDTEQWTTGLGFEEKSAWKPWIMNDQVVGYVTQYNVNSFKYVVIKGAGHMVPEDKPEAAFEMFQRFIKDIDY